MGDNEAYLDNLLKSMNGEEATGGNDGNKMMSADEIAAMFAAMEETAPASEPVVEETFAPTEEPVTEEAFLPAEEPMVMDDFFAEELADAQPEEDSMALPQDLLNDFLQKFEEQEAEARNEDNPTDILAEIAKIEAEDSQADMFETENFETAGGFRDTYTTESTQNMSETEIEQLLAATEQQAENDNAEMDSVFSGEESFTEEMDHEDLLALLGSLDTNVGTDEGNLFSEPEDFCGEEQTGDYTEDLMSGVAVAERRKKS